MYIRAQSIPHLEFRISHLTGIATRYNLIFLVPPLIKVASASVTGALSIYY